MSCQQWNILFAFRESRQFNRKDAQAIIEIAAKPFRLALRFQIAVRCCDDSNINHPAPFFAHTLEFAFLQNSQQLALQIEWNFANLVKKQRTTIRQLKATDPIADGPGEAALRVSKELAVV